MVAWVNTGRGVSLDGDLFIGTIGGAPAKKVATHIICGGKAPTWSPDSRSMQAAQRSGDKVTYGLISAVGYAACDPSRMLGVERVVDTTTGKEIALPVAKVERVYFRTDGSMIAIAQNTGCVIVDGKIVARQQLAGDGLEILSYTA